MKDILQTAQSLLPQMIEDRHFLHQHPELGMDLPISAGFIKNRLLAIKQSLTFGF